MATALAFEQKTYKSSRFPTINFPLNHYKLKEVPVNTVFMLQEAQWVRVSGETLTSWELISHR